MLFIIEKQLETCHSPSIVICFNKRWRGAQQPPKNSVVLGDSPLPLRCHESVHLYLMLFILGHTCTCVLAII